MHDVIRTPWPHIVVDDFLLSDDFAELSNIDTSTVGPYERKTFRGNQVFADGRVLTRDLSRNLVERLHTRYHDRSMTLLRKLAPDKVPLFDYADYELIITGSKCAFAVHDDTWDKLLSIVVYLAPEVNAGTVIYDNKQGRNPQNIEWRRNRALVFSRREGVTWHGYKGDGINNRLALVYNLVSTDMRGVYRAEGENIVGVHLRRLLKKARNKLGYKPAMTS